MDVGSVLFAGHRVSSFILIYDQLHGQVLKLGQLARSFEEGDLIG